MVRKGGVSLANSCVSHGDDYEVLLIRVSHWLWKWYRTTPDRNYASYLSDSIDSVARVKQAFREPMRANREAQSERMKKVRASR